MERYSILYIDDELIPIEILKSSLDRAGLGKEFTVNWARDIYMGVDMLDTKLFSFDLVICDIQGTSLNIDFKDIPKHIKHPNLVITSSVFIPQNKGIIFVEKSNLFEYVKNLLSKVS